MNNNIPPIPVNSFRVVLNLEKAEKRIDTVLLAAIRAQNENIKLKNISRTEFKELFTTGKILIKGQRAKTSSSLTKGITYVDIIIND